MINCTASLHAFKNTYNTVLGLDATKQSSFYAALATLGWLMHFYPREGYASEYGAKKSTICSQSFVNIKPDTGLCILYVGYLDISISGGSAEPL